MFVGQPDWQPSDVGTLLSKRLAIRLRSVRAARSSGQRQQPPFTAVGICIAITSGYVEASWIDRTRQTPWVRNPGLSGDLPAAESAHVTENHEERARTFATFVVQTACRRCARM